MNKEKVIEITNKLYKQTLLFPKKEPLRYKMREVADNILTEIVGWETSHKLNPGWLSVEKDFAVLKSYFNVAKWQNWASYFDLLKLEDEYDKLERDLKEEIESLKQIEKLSQIEEGLNKKEHKEQEKRDKSEKEEINNFSDFLEPLEPRKRKIIEILKEKEKIQVWEVKKVFPNVSKRTIRRDFDKLVKQGLIERIGTRNETFYRLIKK